MLLPVVVILLAYHPVTLHTVSGKVTDDQGNPIVSVSVVAKGTNTATLSGQDGSYQINISDKNATLVFRPSVINRRR